MGKVVKNFKNGPQSELFLENTNNGMSFLVHVSPFVNNVSLNIRLQTIHLYRP